MRAAVPAERLAFGLIRDTQRARLLLAASSKHASEALLDPPLGRCWCGDHKHPGGVDRDQLERLEPDLERAVTDELAEVVSDLLPVVAIGKARDPELSTDFVEVDSDLSSALATVSGDVRLLDKDRVRRAPPFRGAGGVFPGSGVQGFPPRARVSRRGFCRGFRRGFCRGFERQSKVSDPDRPLPPKPRSRQDTSRAKLSDPDRPFARKPRSGQDTSRL